MLVPIALFAAVFSVPIVAILSNALARVICHWRDVSLKIRMVEAGFTAAEIDLVVSGRRQAGSKEYDLPPVKKPPRSRESWPAASG